MAGNSAQFQFCRGTSDQWGVERFNRTIEKQVTYGRVFKNLDEVSQAVIEFRDNYNRHWRLEKLGFMTPLEARQRYNEDRLHSLAA